MIIWRERPFANDHLEDLDFCNRWSGGTGLFQMIDSSPLTLVTSARIQIQSRGSFQNNLFLLCSVLLRKLKIQDLPPGIRGQDLKPCSACVCTSSSGTDTRLNNPFGLLRKSLVKVFLKIMARAMIFTLKKTMTRGEFPPGEYHFITFPDPSPPPHFPIINSDYATISLSQEIGFD